MESFFGPNTLLTSLNVIDSSPVDCLLLTRHRCLTILSIIGTYKCFLCYSASIQSSDSAYFCLDTDLWFYLICFDTYLLFCLLFPQYRYVLFSSKNHGSVNGHDPSVDLSIEHFKLIVVLSTDEKVQNSSVVYLLVLKTTTCVTRKTGNVICK